MLWNHPLQLRKAARPEVTGVSLRGGTERLLSEAVMVKPRLPWRIQNFGDAGVILDIHLGTHQGSGVGE